MIKQRDTRWWFALNGCLRYAVWNGAAPWAFYPAINEYPKSGGSWLSQLLGEAFGLPNPRNRLPHFTSSILHGHHLNLINPSKQIMVWRDGRDVVTSFYHHLLKPNNFASESNQSRVQKLMGDVDPADISANLPRFIELLSTGQVTPGFGWQDFVAKWHGHKSVVAETRYEDMLADTAGELSRIMRAFGKPLDPARAQAIEEKFAFKAQAKRAPGQEDSTSFLRKGVAGDWKNVFSPEACQVFDHYCGEALIALGYECDSQ